MQISMINQRLITIAAIVMALVLAWPANLTSAQSPKEKDKDKGATKDQRAAEVIDQSSSDAARARGEINFDDLKFPIEIDQRFEDELLTDDVKSLDGRRVKLRGYILPTTLFRQTGIRQFILVRDNQECCFGPGAALFDCVVVDMIPGETTDFATRPVTVEGVFTIDTKTYAHPGGKGPKGTSHFAIFHIDGESVK